MLSHDISSVIRSPRIFDVNSKAIPLGSKMRDRLFR